MQFSVIKELRKAQNHIKVGQLEDAKVIYKQIISKFPKNKKAIQGYNKLKCRIIFKDGQ